MRLTILFVCAVLGACGDKTDPAKLPIDSQPPPAIDSMQPPSIDADPSIAPLVGTWTRPSDGPPAQPLTMLTFTADGKVTANGTDPGTYDVPVPGSLHLSSGNTNSTSDFVIAGNRLGLSAYLAQGAVSGVTGTWKDSFISNGSVGSAQFMINTDHSGTYTLTGPSGSSNFPGTWVADGAGFIFTVTATPSLTYTMRPIGASAITYLLFERMP